MFEVDVKLLFMDGGWMKWLSFRCRYNICVTVPDDNPREKPELVLLFVDMQIFFRAKKRGLGGP